MSTYGPSERKILKERRRAKAEREAIDSGELPDYDGADDPFSAENFRAVADRAAREKKKQRVSDGAESFDGYKLRDLLLSKWGKPLDVDLQRRPPRSVYCTIMPVAYGSRKCRHGTELEYLMHLQGIVEILDKYDNLELFLNFIRTTNRTPLGGTDSVPFLMALSDDELDKILG
eukprot:CAMPEP_0194342354 /NCGR_PEP_ID=MMETSP0171-20130528/92555_1 /TAXON_ID=218684 /ORGANISM="Corethron pennatum, Strain L29A3" /LENGTH=173 /DNA_ID=CAMNT_0039108045 /DNA_START=228 /DNA_END=749 /DNA_ORIENTATION=+